MMMFSSDKDITPDIEELTIFDKITVLIHGISLPRPISRRTPAEKGLSWQELTIDCADNQHLSAWYIPAENSRNLAVLYHGYCGEKSSMLDSAELLHGMGWNTLLVDFRGSGGSSGSWTSIGYYEADDVICSM
ncbi:hypothetical protein K8T06_17780, partial [bacterium]|nr:hypothetical protein [bacterium]